MIISGRAPVHALADVVRRYAVVVFVQHHIAVAEYRSRLPGPVPTFGRLPVAFHLVVDGRQGLEESLLHLVEQLAARLFPAAQPTAVKRLQ